MSADPRPHSCFWDRIRRMLRFLVRALSRLFLTLSVVGLMGLLLARFITALHSMTRVFSVGEAPREPVVIVFGAGLRRDGSATAILRDRVRTAADLYFAGKAPRLLMSGDFRGPGYDEPQAMRQHALSLGVPEDAILTDRAGLRTYDTCYRAREVFGLRSAILVTQHFHLPRALFTCRGLGVEAVGVAADNYYYLKRSRLYWNVRELFATFGAFVDLYVKQPAPLVVSSEAIRARAN